MNSYEWNILDTGVHTAEENMRLDRELLETLDPYALPILHFYEWERDSATYGHFTDPSQFLDLHEAKRRGLELAKRPTGGGIVFHIWDFAFSVLIPAEHPQFSPNTLDNYGFVNNAVLSAVSAFLSGRPPLEIIKEDLPAADPSCQRFCMAQPTKYDVVLHGKKIAGAAQRKTKKGFLHQGTIALKVPPREYLEAVLLPHSKVLEAIEARTFPLIQSEEDIEKARQELKSLLQKHMTQEYSYVTKE